MRPVTVALACVVHLQYPSRYRLPPCSYLSLCAVVATCGADPPRIGLGCGGPRRAAAAHNAACVYTHDSPGG
eukprot:952310-Pyramimonas_sp.AAC.1